LLQVERSAERVICLRDLGGRGRVWQVDRSCTGALWVLAKMLFYGSFARLGEVLGREGCFVACRQVRRMFISFHLKPLYMVVVLRKVYGRSLTQFSET
jgi:hypothetical protein